MILIFGGTTEGREAVRTLDGAGAAYYYSTRGESQQVECKHGIRVSGGMDVAGMESFCRERGIRLMVDAAHPFAVALHRNIATVSALLGIPVVRYERIYPPRDPNLVWCDTFDEAIGYLEKKQISGLLALTGVQTISCLEGYWKKHPCWFRVLNREESHRLALDAGFPSERLLYFEDGESDEALIGRLHPGAILTKESGKSGFFAEKVQAAKANGIPVIVIKRPLLSADFHLVTGGHGLRHRVERLLPGFFPLASGYTTGSCACAAVKAALSALLTGKEQKRVHITLPGGEEISLDIHHTACSSSEVTCGVVKDAGDDPDVTNGCLITAGVSLCDAPGVHFLRGDGVGIVTLPGLGLEPGEPAINPAPRQMIRNEVEELLKLYPIEKGVNVKISVENGAALALKTFNPKLGIVGGISIIGTSGIVRPFSTEAFIHTIRKEIQVARALGCDHLVINSGAKSERALKKRFPDLLPQAFVHYGNFIGDTLKMADEEGIRRITMGIMIGKAVKLAEGNLDTHSEKGTMNKAFITTIAREAGCPVDGIDGMTLARELLVLYAGTPVFFNTLLDRCYLQCRPLLKQAQLTIILIPEEEMTEI